MIAVQGPKAQAVVGALYPRAAGMPRFGILSEGSGSSEVFISRTGYTGEDGFEIIAPNSQMPELYSVLFEKGKEHGLVPCGLGARDTLRLEAGYLLYGQDVDEEHTPLEANYGWVVRWNKVDFIGKEALQRQKASGISRRLTSFQLLERGVPRPAAAGTSG